MTSRPGRASLRFGATGSPHGVRKGPFARLANLDIDPVLALSSLCLLMAWLVPDSIGERISWPMERLQLLTGFDVLSTVLAPACGALLLSLVIAPISALIRSALGLFVCAIAIIGIGIWGGLRLSVPGEIALIAGLLAVLAAWISAGWLKKPFLTHAILAIVPLSLLGAAIYGIALGEVSLRLLGVLRDPLVLYGAMIGLTGSILGLRAYRASDRVDGISA